MTAVHVHWGHRGREETVRRASRHFYWPNMSETAKAVKNVCLTCQERDGPLSHRKSSLFLPLRPSPSSACVLILLDPSSHPPKVIATSSPFWIPTPGGTRPFPLAPAALEL